MNIFDNLQTTAFNIVTHTMGYDAAWQAGTNDYSVFDFSDLDFETGTLLKAKVLYKGPTEKERLAGVDYDPDKLILEYQEGNFPGLKQRVDSNNREAIRILNVSGLWLDIVVLSISRKWDGKTYEARINIKAFGEM